MRKRLIYLVAAIVLFVATATVSSHGSKGHWEKTAYSHGDFHYAWVGTTVVPCSVNIFHDGSLSVSVIRPGEVGWHYYASNGKITSIVTSTPPVPGEEAILIGSKAFSSVGPYNTDYVKGACSHALALLPPDARYTFHGLWGVAG